MKNKKTVLLLVVDYLVSFTREWNNLGFIRAGESKIWLENCKICQQQKTKEVFFIFHLQKN